MAETDNEILAHIIYSSVASEGFEKHDLEQILAVAHKHNHEINVSGILLFDGSSFLQVLEGEQSTIEQLFDEIVTDDRHEKTMLLTSENIETRDFDSWSMGYARVTFGQIQESFPTNDFFRGATCLADLNLGRTQQVLEKFKSGSWRRKLT